MVKSDPRTRLDPIEARFREFHAKNPHVYCRLVNMARQLKRKGHARYSIDSLAHALRWEYAIDTVDTLPFAFKINNNHVSRYARLIMEQESDLDGFFELRRLQAGQGRAA